MMPSRRTVTIELDSRELHYCINTLYILLLKPMTYKIKALLIEPDQRSEIVFALAHHRPGCLRMVVADDSQKNFFQDVLLNINFANIYVSTFDSFLSESNSE